MRREKWRARSVSAPFRPRIRIRQEPAKQTGFRSDVGVNDLPLLSNRQDISALQGLSLCYSDAYARIDQRPVES